MSSTKTPWTCPADGSPLSREGDEWINAQTSVRYPHVDGIPWLFPDPRPTLSAWRERSAMLLAQLETELTDLKRQADQAAAALTKQRLHENRRLKILHFEMLKRTLAGLKPGAHLALAQQVAYGYRLPLRQGLMGYFPNLVRDWSGLYEGENQILLGAFTEMLTQASVQTILVLGAGGSRLAYDLALARPESRVIALDLNPTLLLAANAIVSGKSLTAVEQAVAPLQPEKPGREVKLSRPGAAVSNLEFVFGDVYALPLATASIDLCVTPWLVDIVPRPWTELCASIARVVKPGGAWLNAGSWNFTLQNEAENLSLAEAAEQAAALGWSSGPSTPAPLETPYLQSPFDAHRRYERLTRFCWQRNQTEVRHRPPIDDRPMWIRNPQLPVPALAAFGETAAKHAAVALLLSLADGQTSLAQMAQVLAAEHGFSEAQGLDAAASYFERFVRDRRFREQI